MDRFGFAFAAVAALLVGQIALATVAQEKAPIDAAADYPPTDLQFLGLAESGAIGAEAGRALQKAPGSVRTLALLLQARRVEDALAVVNEIVSSHPTETADAFQLLFDFQELLVDQPTTTPAVLNLVDRARSSLVVMPRQQAARAARAILELELRIRSTKETRAALLRQFVDDYRGTDAALSTSVDLVFLTERGPDRLRALSALAQEHATDDVAAKALYLRATLVASGGAVTMTPAQRLRNVITAVDELKWRFPSSEWTRRSSTLIEEFRSDEGIDSASAGDLLREYAAYLTTHFQLSQRSPLHAGIGYVIEERLPELYRARGEEAESMIDHLLTQVRRSSATNADAVDYFRAVRELDRLLPSENATNSVHWQRAITWLRTLATSSKGPYGRKALATLASAHFIARDYEGGRRVYSEFVLKYPVSEWKWVATLRLGQCEEKLGRFDRALASYQSIAGKSAAEQLLSAVSRSRASAMLGDLSRASREMDQAVDVWSESFPDVSTLRYPAWPTVLAPDSDSSIDRSWLLNQQAELKLFSQAPGGSILETARVLVFSGKYADAQAAVARFQRSHPQSALSNAAAYVNHEAELERLISDLSSPLSKRQDSERAFEALASERPDFATVAAGIGAALLAHEHDDFRAEKLLIQSLTRWRALGAPSLPITNWRQLEDDVVGIRAAVLKPTGEGMLRTVGWSDFAWPDTQPAFVVVNPTITVRLPNREVGQITVYGDTAFLGGALFMPSEMNQVLQRLLTAIGKTRPSPQLPADVMDLPNREVANLKWVIDYLSRFLSVRPGHDAGWDLETAPSMVELVFLNADRSRAEVRVRVGYSAATMTLHKIGKEWQPVSLRNLSVR